MDSGKECLSIHCLSLVYLFQDPDSTAVNIATSFFVVVTSTFASTCLQVVDDEVASVIYRDLPFLPSNIMSISIFSMIVCILSNTLTIAHCLIMTNLLQLTDLNVPVGSKVFNFKIELLQTVVLQFIVSRQFGILCILAHSRSPQAVLFLLVQEHSTVPQVINNVCFFSQDHSQCGIELFQLGFDSGNS